MSRSKAAATQGSSEVGTPTEENETQEETHVHERTRQADVRQAEIEAGQALQQLRTPQAETQSMDGIPQVVGTGSSGIPIVGQATALADEVPAVGSRQRTPRRLRVAPQSDATSHGQVLQQILPIRPSSTPHAAAMLPRLASLSTPISIPGVAPDTLEASGDADNGRPSGLRMPNPLKRRRTRDSSASSSRSTPDPMPQMRLKNIEDYPLLGTDEISRLPISYFCRDNRHGRPTREFVERENTSIRKMYEPLTKNSSADDDQGTRVAAAEKSLGKSRDHPNEDADSSAQPAASSNRMAAQVRIVDGKVVLDSASLVISRSDMAGAGDEPLEIVDESARPRFVNSLTYVQKRASRKRWTNEETEEFYVALRRYGSDFEMMAAAMPGRNRYDIRNKFKVEERKNARRVTDTLLAQRSPPPTPLSATKVATIELHSDGDNEQQTAMLKTYSVAALSDEE
ncbi:hypothetical protein GGI22_003099 [Coemansia erecta]|nr:hypothetical protein GGI22_003099 [Coemansia erecta]